MLGQGGKTHNMGFLSCITALSEFFFLLVVLLTGGRGKYPQLKWLAGDYVHTFRNQFHGFGFKAFLVVI